MNLQTKRDLHERRDVYLMLCKPWLYLHCRVIFQPNTGIINFLQSEICQKANVFENYVCELACQNRKEKKACLIDDKHSRENIGMFQ